MTQEDLILHTSGNMRQIHMVNGPLQRHTHTYDLMRQCIHCGFCLPTCPTYAVLGVEMDSPRGRIYQMQAVADGRLQVDTDFIEHMNCCVGCRACETACPSGVQFGKLIEAAREHIQITTTTSSLPDVQKGVTQPHTHSIAMIWLRRFFFDYMLPSRPILTFIFAGLKIYQRSGMQSLVRKTKLIRLIDSLPTPFQGKLQLPDALMQHTGGTLIPNKFPLQTDAHGKKRMRVGFISGCIMDQMFHDINQATIRVLTANGCEVITPLQQNCCGALHIHAGEIEKGRALARQMIDTFEPYHCDFIIINSAGCGSTLKEYDHLLRDDPSYAEQAIAFCSKIKDISEFLMSIHLNRHMGEIKRVVAYHDACHLAHGQKIKQQPRQILKMLPGIKMVDLPESDWCCGSAGIYNLTNQDMGQALLDRKMNNIEKTGALCIATGNPGCMMQIAMGVRQRGLAIEVVHPIQLLDEAYQKAGVYDTLPQREKTSKKKYKSLFLAGMSAITLLIILLLRQKFQSHKRPKG